MPYEHSEYGILLCSLSWKVLKSNISSTPEIVKQFLMESEQLCYGGIV